MKKRCFKGGFTLIELLVVVLIIGILAAIALPQYNKAVAKSRFASIKPIAKAIKDAQEIYFEIHGQYATQSKLRDLDIDYPTDVDVELSETDGYKYISVGHDKLNNRYTMYLSHSDNFANNIYCEALSTDTQANDLCVSERGETTGETNGDYTLYLLLGVSTGNGPATSGGPTIVPGGCVSNPGNSKCTRYIYEDRSLDYFVPGQWAKIVTEYDAQGNKINVYYYNGDGSVYGQGSEQTQMSLCERFPDLCED